MSQALIALGKAASEGPVNYSVRSEQPELVSVSQSVTVAEGTYGVKFPMKILDVPAQGTSVRLYVTAGDLQRSNTLILSLPLQSLNIPQKDQGMSR
jgi:hypothetical protein